MKSKGYIWSFKFSTVTLVLITAAVGINYLGKLFAEILKLPLWLDSIGTCLAAILGGPIAGAMSGAINNIIYGFTSPVSYIYAITSVGIGIIVGIFARCGWTNHLKGAVFTGLFAGLTAIVISTPLNIIVWSGMTGNVWGDALFTWAAEKNLPIWLASALNELVVDLPDKLVVMLLAFEITQRLPKRLANLYKSENKLDNKKGMNEYE